MSLEQICVFKAAKLSEVQVLWVSPCNKSRDVSLYVEAEGVVEN